MLKLGKCGNSGPNVLPTNAVRVVGSQMTVLSMVSPPGQLSSSKRTLPVSTTSVSVNSASRAEQAAFLEAHPRGKDGRLEYDLERGFGVRPEDLRKRFAFYFERFPVRVEES